MTNSMLRNVDKDQLKKACTLAIIKIRVAQRKLKKQSKTQQDCLEFEYQNKINSFGFVKSLTKYFIQKPNIKFLQKNSNKLLEDLESELNYIKSISLMIKFCDSIDMSFDDMAMITKWLKETK